MPVAGAWGSGRHGCESNALGLVVAGGTCQAVGLAAEYPRAPRLSLCTWWKRGIQIADTWDFLGNPTRERGKRRLGRDVARTLVEWDHCPVQTSGQWSQATTEWYNVVRQQRNCKN
jgi:hypothetical protein